MRYELERILFENRLSYVGIRSSLWGAGRHERFDGVVQAFQVARWAIVHARHTTLSRGPWQLFSLHGAKLLNFSQVVAG